MNPLFVSDTRSLSTSTSTANGAAHTRGDQSSVAALQASLDPLTPAEMALARQVASDEPKVKKQLGAGRHRLVQVQFFTSKPTETESAGQSNDRHAAVVFYRYATDDGIHVVVNLSRRAALYITRIDGWAVPLAQDEVSDAFALAMRNPKVRATIGGAADEFRVGPIAAKPASQSRVEGLRVLGASPRDPCHRHRCVELHFRRPTGYVHKTSVIVDLSAQRLTINHFK